MFNNTNSVSKEQEIVPKEEDVLKEEIIDDNNLSSETTQDLKAKRSQSKSSKNRGNPTPCPVCGVIICNSYNLSCHLRRHNNDKPYKCDQCPAAFILKTELQRHSVTHSKDRPFKCSICSKGYKNVEVLRVHVDTHGFNEYKCKHCDATFRDYRSCSSHEKNFHNKNKLKCTYCYKTFSENKFREEHEILVHSKRFYIKPDQRRIHKHKQTQKALKCFDSNFKFYSCKVCSERFKYRNDQLSHYQANHKEVFDKIFKICNICSKILTDKHYSDHMKVHEGNLPYACVHCDYKSARKVDLRIHTLKHKREKFIKCSNCQKSFRTRALAHLCEKRHTGKKDVKCRTCDKAYFTVLELRSHELRKHINRKCFVCGYETTNAHNFYQHKKLHKSKEQTMKNKPFMCNKCGLYYKTSAAFISHAKVHNEYNVPISQNKKPNTCSYCDHQGLSSSDILNHCIEFHPTKVNTCEICSYTTLNILRFESHIRHHISKSAEELYVCTGINKKLEKEHNSFILECFICGFSSIGKDHMEKHFEKHKRMFEEFPWFCSEEGFNLNFTLKGRKRRSVRKCQNFGKRRKKPKIKNASEPVTVSKVHHDEHEVIVESDEIDDYVELSDKEFSDLLVPNDDEFYQAKKPAKQKSSSCVKSTTKDNHDTDDSTQTKSKTLPNNNLESSNSSISTTTKTTAAAERSDNSEKLTIKIRKFKQIGEACGTKDGSLNSADYLLNQTEDRSSATNINSLKSKVQTINGKLFLPVEDLCSLSKVTKETLLNLFRTDNYENKDYIKDGRK